MKPTLLTGFFVAFMALGGACGSGSGASAGTGGGSLPGGHGGAVGSTSSGGSAGAVGSTSSGGSGLAAGTGGAAGMGGSRPSGGAQGTGGALSPGGRQETGGAENMGGTRSTGLQSAGGTQVAGTQGSGGAAAGSGGAQQSGGSQGSASTRARTIETRGFKFDALESGSSGEPVLLLHGFPDTSLEWTGVMPALSTNGYHCLAPDQRGYSPGARPTEVDAYRYEELVADAFAIASELGSRFHVIGHDWGANVGWLMLQKEPSRIASFTAISIPHYQVWARSVYEDNAMAGYLSMLNTWMSEGRGEAYWTAEQMRRMWTAKPSAQREATIAHMTEAGAMTAALNWYRASRGHKSVIDEFEAWEVNVPTLLIHGSKDLGERSVTDTAALMKGPYRVVRPEGGHFIVDEQPQAVVDQILAHLRAYPLK